MSGSPRAAARVYDRQAVYCSIFTAKISNPRSFLADDVRSKCGKIHGRKDKRYHCIHSLLLLLLYYRHCIMIPHGDTRKERQTKDTTASTQPLATALHTTEVSIILSSGSTSGTASDYRGTHKKSITNQKNITDQKHESCQKSGRRSGGVDQEPV